LRQVTQLPVLSTYKQERARWVVRPRPTEQLLLTASTCMVCPGGYGRAAREHSFIVNSHGRDFFFACDSAYEVQDWVRAVSQSIAQAALRLGGQSDAEARLLDRAPLLSPGAPSPVALTRAPADGHAALASDSATATPPGHTASAMHRLRAPAAPTSRPTSGK